MTADDLFQKIREKQSFLCIGLDPDISKFPESILETDDPVYEFNKRIVDATHQLAVAYKPNIAFYESAGSGGLWSLEKTVEYIRKKDPGIFLIADAKRGDIGNSSKRYARAWFETYGFDAVTVAPYMGEDSVRPFLDIKDKWTVLLAVTSNSGAADFQFMKDQETGMQLFEKVISTASGWGTPDNMMFVVGATQPGMLRRAREIVPGHFLLVPGVGVQGGSLAAVAENGLNDQCGLLVNSSRAVIHADESDEFDLAARLKASMLKNEMAVLLREKGLIT
ncbi:MAG: orotidine-5'-phosphate decarboxylase [Marinilabiliales bacterium]|nr:MAG: orotidine-5'-phosphate decarboxylase [Marinilabiliales bacterium]